MSEPADLKAGPSAATSDDDDDEAAAAWLQAAQRKVDRMLVGSTSLVDDLPRCVPLAAALDWATGVRLWEAVILA